MVRRRASRMPKEKKLKPVNFAPIEREHAGKLTEPYKVMENLIGKHHKDLNEAECRILIGWDLGPTKPDADGFIKFGRVKKGADVDREMAKYDVLIVIRKNIWASFDNTRKHAEIDRLLCRVAVVRDAHGEIVVDEKGRSQFRLRKPVEVFPENVARFGFHQEPKLAECLTRYNDSQRPLLKDNDKPKKPAKRFHEAALSNGETPPETHLKNGNGKAHTNGKATKPPKEKVAPPKPEPGTLEALELPHPIVEAAHAADLRTVDDVIRFHTEYGALALAELKGMGSERADALWSAAEKYQAEHAVEAK